MTAPLVLVLYNHPLLPHDHPDAESEHTIVDIALSMGDILREDGYRIAMLGLQAGSTDLVERIAAAQAGRDLQSV